VQRQFVEDLYAGTLLGDGTEMGSGLSRGSGPSGGGMFGARYGAEAYGGRPVKVRVQADVSVVTHSSCAIALHIYCSMRRCLVSRS
jgi:hypothetical protein